jgi:phosphatidylethanolamine/phosphatidyl-N-methylethanolamine N-methyltransferase
MNDFTLFLSKFLTQGTAIASIAPSSRWLSHATVRNIDWGQARVLVELGAGTGPITRVIAERACSDCRVIVVERDVDFVRLLHARFGNRANFSVVEGDVRDLKSILAERGITTVDHVISGLAVPSLARDLQRELFRTIRDVLRADGTFNQITELPWLYWRFYLRFFEDVQFTFEPRNLPPAGAYHCRGVRDIG